MIKNIFIVQIIYLILNLNCKYPNDEKFVQIIFRHGDRAPIHIMPTMQFFWNDLGISEGELSEIGKTQLLVLGDFLNNRYLKTDSLEKDSDSFLQVLSTDYNRTISSALSFLKGLFPVQKVPIPIHIVHTETNQILLFHKNCPSYTSSLDFLSNNISSTANDIFDLVKIREITGWNDESDIISYLNDNLICMKAHNATIDSYFETILEKIQDFKKKFIYKTYAQKSLELPGPMASEFLKKILDNIRLYSKEMIREKMLIFSGHDSNLVGVFDALDLIKNEKDDLLFPSYASSIIFEYTNASDHLSVFYGKVSLNGTEWVYNIEELGCDNSSVLCSTNSFMSHIDSFPDFNNNCCYLSKDFYRNGCDNYYSEETKNNLVCQSYRKFCPMIACGPNAVYSEVLDLCLEIKQHRDLHKIPPISNWMVVFTAILLSIMVVVLSWICLHNKDHEDYLEVKVNGSTEN